MPIRCCVVVLALLCAACGGSSDGAEGPRDETLVFAASSLNNAFSDIETAYEQQNPSADIVLSFAGSSSLREQLLDGAPAEVFASANIANIDIITEAGLADGAGPWFATNTISIAVPEANPAGIVDLSAFADDSLAIGLCAEAVPCGTAAAALLASAGVSPKVDTYEPNVAALATRLSDGELDAGLVYRTDIIASQGRLEVVESPDIPEQRLVYSIVPIVGSDNAEGAADFIEFVVSDEGQAILAMHGFGPGESP